MTMADLLAKQSNEVVSITRGQEIEGEIISANDNVFILDLGAKSEGVLYKKDLPSDLIAKLKVGDKLKTFVVYPENDSGQVALGLNKVGPKGANNARFARFEQAQKNNEVLMGKGLEINKGGLIVEVGAVRGFLPSSQVNLSQVNNLDELIGKEIKVNVIEVDGAQNRLIFSQVVTVSDETKQLLGQVKIGDEVKGVIIAVLSFGLAVKLENSLEGFVHISEASWEKVEDLNTTFKEGDEVQAKVISIDQVGGRVNLSIKQLLSDPFSETVKKFQPDDVVKGTIKSIDANAVVITLSDDIEGVIPSSKLDSEQQYSVGEIANFVVDSIDEKRRRVNLVPFITSTKDLIYK